MENNVPKYLEHDVQAETDGFNRIRINKVGVRKIKMPVEIEQRDCADPFRTIAHISAYCDLDKDKKGINMSRNSRTLLNELSNNKLTLKKIEETVEKLAEAHETTNINLKFWFEYTYCAKSPQTDICTYEPCVVVVDAKYNKGEHKIFLQVISNESSCCPCSKNMSSLVANLSDKEVEQLASKLDLGLYSKVINAGFGAHNQRSEIDIKVELDKSQGIMWIEDLVEIAQKASSAATFNVLKREDEKYVTEVQYMGGYFDEKGNFQKVEMSGPKFVEDIARDAAKLLNEELDKRIKDYVVVVNNEESIHTTLLATAIIDAGRNLH